MKLAGWGLVVVAVAVGLLATARWSLHAQDQGVKAHGQARPKVEPTTPKVNSLSVQDALQRPMDLPFEQETSLEEVRKYLARALGAPVVLDRSALDRLELKPDDTVQLDLKGVRLKVGLRLLLDQVGLAYKVVPEDNLLILTDPEGSDDTGQRVLAEIKSLHREMHDLQDVINDLRDLVEEDLGVESDLPKHQSKLVRLGRGGKPSRRVSRNASPRPTTGVGG